MPSTFDIKCQVFTISRLAEIFLGFLPQEVGNIGRELHLKLYFFAKVGIFLQTQHKTMQIVCFYCDNIRIIWNFQK